MTAFTYAIISLANTILTSVMSGWLIYFYLPPGGNALVPLSLFGLVVFISRISHVAANITLNRFAPRTVSGWGWYMIGAALVIPALFILLWLPPAASETNANLLHLFLVLVAFNIATGVHQAAYETLLPVFAVTDKERGAISNWRMVSLLVGSILAAFTGPLIQAFHYTQAIWIFTLGSAPFLIVPALLLLGRLGSENRTLVRVPFLKSVKAAWAIPAFRVFAISWALMWLATTFTYETIPYIVTEICRLSKTEAVYFYLTPLVVSAIAYPFIGKLAGRYGLKIVFRASLLAGAVAMCGLILIGERIPLPLFAQGLVWIILQTICLSGAQSIPGAIIAEITANDSTQQSSLYAFGNLIDQLSSGLALAIIPFFLLFGRSLVDLSGPLGVRMLAPAGALFLLAAFFVFGGYKINKSGRLN